LTSHQTQASVQGKPSPRKTLTELEPVMFPMAESASGDERAAVMDAKVSGSDVPKATRVIPVTDGLRLITHPRTVATWPTIVVTTPISASETMKAAQPPQIGLGGTVAPKTFQKMERSYQTASKQPTSSTIRFSSLIEGPNMHAILN